MTRENKLALVVGFGLILFVGILISDHFSIARSQQAANFAGDLSDPLALNERRETALVDLGELPAPAAAGNSAQPDAGSITAARGQDDALASGGGYDPTARPVAESSRPEQRTAIDRNADVRRARRDSISEAGSTPVHDSDSRMAAERDEVAVPGFARVDSPPEIPVQDLRFRDVQPGESLYTICKQEYGDASLVTALAKFNKMDDPSQLRTGRRLVLPEAESLGGAASKKSGKSKVAAPQTYTVQKGDNLSRIAQKYLGDKERWRELHTLNRSIIDDPNNLKVGMVIRLS